MLLDPDDVGARPQAIDEVLPRDARRAGRAASRPRRTPRPLELSTGVAAHRGRGDRRAVRCCARGWAATCATCGLARAAAGTHPFAVWRETAVSRGDRYAARSTARCASSPAASRPSRCTSTSACPTPRTRSAPPTGCAPTCRCCSRCRPTRPSGRAATPASPRPARRCSRPSRASASRARSTTTPSTSRRSTC